MSVFYQIAAQAGLLKGSSQPPVRVGDIIEYHEYQDYKYADGVYPTWAGEVLELLCDEKGTLVGLKIHARARCCVMEWGPREEIVIRKFCKVVPPTWKVHTNFESFLEQNHCVSSFL